MFVFFRCVVYALLRFAYAIFVLGRLRPILTLFVVFFNKVSILCTDLIPLLCTILVVFFEQ